MKEFLKKYVWLWEMIAVALIIACAILIVLKNEFLSIIVGLILAVLGLLRIVPLVKTTDDKVLKILNLIEMIINILVGALLIYIGFASDNDASIKEFMNNYFGVFLGSILYLRGFIFFYTVCLRKEETNYPLFFIHIGAITLGTFVLAISLWNKEDILTLKAFAWVIFAICMLSCIFTAYSGVKGYKNYRGNEQNEKITKGMKVELTDSENKMDAPTDDAIKDRINDVNNSINIDIPTPDSDNQEDHNSIRA